MQRTAFEHVQSAFPLPLANRSGRLLLGALDSPRPPLSTPDTGRPRPSAAAPRGLVGGGGGGRLFSGPSCSVHPLPRLPAPVLQQAEARGALPPASREEAPPPRSGGLGRRGGRCCCCEAAAAAEEEEEEEEDGASGRRGVGIGALSGRGAAGSWHAPCGEAAGAERGGAGRRAGADGAIMGRPLASPIAAAAATACLLALAGLLAGRWRGRAGGVGRDCRRGQTAPRARGDEGGRGGHAPKSGGWGGVGVEEGQSPLPRAGSPRRATGGGGCVVVMQDTCYRIHTLSAPTLGLGVCEDGAGGGEAQRNGG